MANLLFRPLSSNGSSVGAVAVEINWNRPLPSSRPLDCSRLTSFQLSKTQLTARLYFLGSDREVEMSCTAVLRLKAKPGDRYSTWKPSKAFDASSRSEAIDTAFDWKRKNISDGYEVQELWLFDGSCQTMLWQSRDLETDVDQSAAASPG